MEILEFCVETLRAQKVDKFELYWEKSSSLSVDIKEGKLDHLSRATDQGLAIRTLKDERMGFSYTFDLSRDAVERAIRTALEIGSLMPADPYNDLGLLKDSYPSVKTFDAAGLETALERKIELAQTVESKARQSDERIKRVRSAGLDETVDEVVLIDSQGKQVRHRSTYFGLHLTCVAEAGSDAEVGSDMEYKHSLDALSADRVAAGAARNALELMHAKSAPTMTCPAVFKNSVVAQLLGFLSGSFSAENIDKNFSLLVGKKGKKIFSEHLNLLDDGLLEGGIATMPFDGEGVASQTKRLIDKGVVAGFLYDTYYARKHGMQSTGNSRRGIKGPPGISSTNLYLEKGARALDELCSGIDRGVYVTNVMGLHTANPVTGEFSVGASGILIENGKRTTPIKGFAIAGNLVELLSLVSEVGSDLRFWGGIGAPSLVVSKLSVSGK